MTTRMLIDAAHPEETRVVVVKGNRLEEFDFESSAKKQIKGNIYLARVTRIEPSLQAAFVEYGGNRHGFLAFNEIHPDYYQIPIADREALLAEEAEAVSIEDEPEDEDALEDALDFEAETADNTVGEAADSHTGQTQINEMEPGQETTNPTDSEAADTAGIAGETDRIEAVKENSDMASTEEVSQKEDKTEDKGPSMALSAGPIDSTRLEEGEKQSDDSETIANAEEIPDLASETDGDLTPSVAVDELVRPEEISEHGTVASEVPETESTETPDISADIAEDTSLAADGRTEVEVPDIDDNQKDEIGVTDIDDDTADIRRRRRTRSRRSYRIQEVIKKRQVLLVQVVKEERGNKGAALTTYLSLAGRYCVLMPNTARGGGISRKITNQTTRRKLKSTLTALDVPKGMGVIVRTAGSERTKSEIKRDFDYLFRVWDNVRDLTLSSQAPTVVYEEANLIKRAIRDLYAKEIDEVLVEGEDGYKLAKSFMRMLMPSHAKKVQPYRDSVPLFHRYQVHQQLDSMHSSVVTLKSGGYLVLNPTEALVAVDVNSGKSTRGKNIEDTALRTNLEAAEELARQLRLRDLAGLVVIDFIDMDEHRNNRNVERRFKECIKGDRARTQVGRISNFGLLEMSRQRLRPSLQEAISIICPHCEGSGYMRSIESSVLHVLRAIEEEGIRGRAATIRAFVSSEVALHALNYKRQTLAEIEERYQIEVTILADDKLISPNYRIEQEGSRDAGPVDHDLTPQPSEPVEERNEGGGRKRRRRRRGKKDERGGQEAAENNNRTAADPARQEDSATEGEDDGKPKRRRRGRRGGRNRKSTRANENEQIESIEQEAGTETLVKSNLSENSDASTITNDAAENEPNNATEVTPEEVKEKAKKPRRRRSPRKKSAAAKTQNSGDGSEVESSDAASEEVTQEPSIAELKPEPVVEITPAVDSKPEPTSTVDPVPAKPKRKGWWQKAIGR